MIATQQASYIKSAQCIARDTDKGDQPTDHSCYLQCQWEERRATLNHFMNTVHWPGFGLFPRQICRVKSILPEEGDGCVCVCVYVCLCKSRRTKWLKGSHPSANISSKKRSKLLNSLAAEKNRGEHLNSFYFGAFYNYRLCLQ